MQKFAQYAANQLVIIDDQNVYRLTANFTFQLMLSKNSPLEII